MKAGKEGGLVRASDFRVVIDHAFGPDVIKLMATAFDCAMKSLTLLPPKNVQEAMAKRIIEAAGAGERRLGDLTDAALRPCALRSAPVCAPSPANRSEAAPPRSENDDEPGAMFTPFLAASHVTNGVAGFDD
jgi:hypothetical protein